MKQLTLTEQLKAVNLADEASQLSLLENCSNIHFLTLALLALSQSIRVRMSILLRKELHVVVLKVLESTMPDHLKGEVRRHPSYKEKKVEGLNFGKFIASFIYDQAEESYVPDTPANDMWWTDTCIERKDDVEWQKGVVYNGTVSHMLEMLEWISLTPELVKLILTSYALQTHMLPVSAEVASKCLTLQDAHCAYEELRKLHSTGRDVLTIIKKSKAFDEEAEALACYLFGEGRFDPSNVALIFPGATSHQKQILSVMKVFSSSVM